MRHRVRVLLELLADEEPLQVGLAVAGLEVAPDELLEADIGLLELVLLRVPAVEDRLVEPVLAAEVVGDQLLVDPRALGDLAGTRAGEALRAELRERGVEQRLARALGIALANVGGGGSAGAAGHRHRSLHGLVDSVTHLVG